MWEAVTFVRDGGNRTSTSLYGICFGQCACSGSTKAWYFQAWVFVVSELSARIRGFDILKILFNRVSELKVCVSATNCWRKCFLPKRRSEIVILNIIKNIITYNKCENWKYDDNVNYYVLNPALIFIIISLSIELYTGCCFVRLFVDAYIAQTIRCYRWCLWKLQRVNRNTIIELYSA